MPAVTVDDLEVAYDVTGPDDGSAVLLLHGWPDDASTWDEVIESLAAAGFRTVVPTLRGFGETRFRSDAAPRTGDSGILAMDAIGLMDALGIQRFAVVGHDWGSNIAEALAVAGRSGSSGSPCCRRRHGSAACRRRLSGTPSASGTTGSW